MEIFNKMKYKHIVLFFLLFTSCHNEPCDDLNNGVYQFPHIPARHSMTQSEVDEYINLPIDICKCISTKGLIETCLNYPFVSIYTIGSNIQTGYELFKQRFRGLDELESRQDCFETLLAKYSSLDPMGYDTTMSPIEVGHFMVQFDLIEVILSQFIVLKDISTEEKIQLLEKAFDQIEKKVIGSDLYSILDIACTSAIFSRVMLISNYEPFLIAYNSDLDFKREVDGIYGISTKSINLILYNANQFLINLKSSR